MKNVDNDHRKNYDKFEKKFWPLEIMDSLYFHQHLKGGIFKNFVSRIVFRFGMFYLQTLILFFITKNTV